MEEDKHKLIAGLSIEYTERMCDSDDNAEFSPGDIAAAYTIGSEKTLRRVCNVIRESCIVGGITDDQTAKLLSAIESVECRQTTEYHGNSASLMPLVYDAVAEILDTKRGSVEPCMAHINEIRNSLNIEIMEALRELCRKNILSVCTDKNKNPMFQIKTAIG